MYEGTKVHRREDGRLLLFRPEQNAIRMKFGAERMSMPSPSIDQFVDAVKQTVLANKRWVILFYLEENAEPLILYEIIISLILYYLFNIIYMWMIMMIRFLLQEKGLCTLGLCSWEVVKYWVWVQHLNTLS